MLAQLNYFTKNSGRKEESNITFTLYLNCLKVFISIIDNWWIEGKLDDWQNEFLLEENYNDNDFRLRSFEKNRNISFHVESSISSKILNDDIINFLIEILVRSSSSLKMLVALDRFGDLKIENESNCCGMFDEDLYNSFFNRVVKDFKEINAKFNLDNTSGVSTNNNLVEAEENNNMCDKNEFNRENFEQEILEMGDEFLLLAFKDSLDIAEQHKNLINCSEVEIMERKTENLLLYER